MQKTRIPSNKITDQTLRLLWYLIQQKKIPIKHYITKKNDIEILHSRAEDHRSIMRTLDESNSESYTFKLQKEKTLEVFLK